MHSSVEARLAGLTPDQRAAATASPGPVVVRRSGRERQDHDAGGSHRLAGRRRCGPGDDRGDHVQQAGGRGARRTGRRGPRTARRRTGSRARPHVPRPGPGDPARCRATGRATRGPRCAVLRAVAEDHDRGARTARHGVLAIEARPRGRAPRRSPRTPTPAPWLERSWSTRPRSRDRGSVDFDDLVRGALLRARGRCRAPRAVARPLRAPAGRRGAGRRSVAAPSRPPARRSGASDLPGRGRRPVDLRLATRRRAAGAGHRRVAAGSPARRPPGEPPLSGPGRRARGAADRPQRGAFRQGHPRADRGTRVARPRPGRGGRAGAHRSTAPLVARRRRDACRPRPHEPGASPGGRRRDGPR